MNLSVNAQLVSQGHQKTVLDGKISLSGLGIRLQRIAAAWAARRQRAREMQTLYAFSDRELWDLGLGRCDLPAISNGTYRRD